MIATFKNGCYRVCQDENSPGLAMSRSLGDTFSRTLGVTGEPTLDVRTISSHSKFLVWGSDGIFEFLNTEDVAEVLFFS